MKNKHAMEFYILTANLLQQPYRIPASPEDANRKNKWPALTGHFVFNKKMFSIIFV